MHYHTMTTAVWEAHVCAKALACAPTGVWYTLSRAASAAVNAFPLLPRIRIVYTSYEPGMHSFVGIIVCITRMYHTYI